VLQVDPLSDDDFGLALYLCYELNYQGVTDAGWEWDTDLLRFRRELETAFLSRIRDETVYDRNAAAADVVAALDELVGRPSGPSLSSHFIESGTLEQFREFCVHRSAYQLRFRRSGAF
jgi:hypothetical protein